MSWISDPDGFAGVRSVWIVHFFSPTIVEYIRASGQLSRRVRPVSRRGFVENAEQRRTGYVS